MPQKTYSELERENILLRESFWLLELEHYQRGLLLAFVQGGVSTLVRFGTNELLEQRTRNEKYAEERNAMFNRPTHVLEINYTDPTLNALISGMIAAFKNSNHYVFEMSELEA